MQLSMTQQFGASCETNRSSRRSERVYDVLVEGADAPEETAVRDEVFNTLISNGLSQDDWGNPIESIRIEENAGGAVDPYYFVARVAWSSVARDETNGTDSIATAGETAHVTQAIAQVCYGSTGIVPDEYGGGIGIDENLSFAGVDVVVPNFVWRRQVKIDANLLTKERIGLIASMKGSVNDVAYSGFGVGDILFYDFSASEGVTTMSGVGGDEETLAVWDVAIEFHVQPTRKNFAATSDITVVEKKGWEYLWFEYRKKTIEDASGESRVVEYPVRAYVSQVYRYSAFIELLRTLGILL